MEVSTKRFRKREAILNCLRRATTHPGAEWVYEQLKPEIPDLSLGTVYRNLSLFKEQGLIRSVGCVKGVERFDGDTRPHVHFICEECASVIDLTELDIPESLNRDAEKAIGGRVDACNVTFFGICENCTV